MIVVSLSCETRSPWMQYHDKNKHIDILLFSKCTLNYLIYQRAIKHGHPIIHECLS